MDFSREAPIQGTKNKAAAEETPETFATMGGADQSSITDIPKSRMAGPVGARALQLMNDPAYAAASEGWMSKFALTPQGAQFNQAKMGTMPEQQPVMQKQQQTQAQPQAQTQSPPPPQQSQQSSEIK